MVICAGDADDMLNLSADLRLVGTDKHDQAVRFLALGDEFYGAT